MLAQANGGPSAHAGGLSDVEEAKRRGVWCAQSRDGRLVFQVSLATTLTRSKAAFVALVVVVCLAYLAAPLFGVEGMRTRIAALEARMAHRVRWVVEHRDHLRAHLAGETDGKPPVRSDGKRHLWTPPGSVSKLAEAVAPHTGLAEFDDHYLCGSHEATESEVMRKTIALAAITWMAPRSLGNAVKTWHDSGLLDIMDERMLFINSPQQADRDIADRYDLDVYTTDEYNGNVMVGPALAYLVGNSTADYILLMEKDFIVSADRATLLREMYVGVQHLARGVHAYRLRGKSDHPAEGMPDCCTPAEPPTCPFHSSWRSAGYFSDHMNWLFIYCDPDILDHSNGRLAKCTSEPEAPDSYCYTSGETNWSNNPVLFPRAWFHERLRQVALKDFERNNMFEFNVMLEWLAWKPPAIVCSSFQGVFKHFEIDQ